MPRPPSTAPTVAPARVLVRHLLLLASGVLAMSSSTSSAAAADTATPAAPAVIPAPQRLVPGQGRFLLRPDTPLLVAAGRPDLHAARDQLAGLITAGTGWTLPQAEADGPRAGAIFLGGLTGEGGGNGEDRADVAAGGAHGPGAADGAEAYTVDVTPQTVALRADHAAGALWAVQTLRQLLPVAMEVRRPDPVADPGRPDGQYRPLPPGHRYPEDNLAPVPRVAPPPVPVPWNPPAAGVPIAAVSIADAPRFGWRGLLLDSCRHFVDIPTIERLLDLMALHKLNVLHWHLTEDQGWRLEIAAYPRLTEVGAWRTAPDGARYGGFYTRKQARHVVAYAAARGITVVPEIEMPGHSQAALAAYPELSCRQEPLAVQDAWGVWPDIYCAGNDAVFTFLETVLAEVLEIFPSAFIHVGGDEAPRDRWEQCPRCRERIAAEGLAGFDHLQTWFLHRIGRWLEARGRRLVGWDEILAGGLVPGATVHSWQGFDGAVAAARAGHRTVVSPTSHAYLDYDVSVTDLAACYAFEPVPPALSPEEAARVLGAQANMWTEYAPQGVLDERLFPRLCALSEVFWSPAPPAADRAGPQVKDPAVIGRDYTAFHRRLQAHAARLARLGVRVGPAARPLDLQAIWDPGRTAWRLDWRPDAVLPGGRVTLALTIGDRTTEHGAAGCDWVHPENRPGAWTARDPRTGEIVVRGQLLVDGEPYGAPEHLRLRDDLALGVTHLAEPTPSARYTPTVARPVTGGVRPDGDYHDGRWLAWEGPAATVTLDLGLEGGTFRRVTARCLQAGGRLIQVPGTVAVEISADGERWWPLGPAAAARISPRVMARVMADYVVEAPQAVSARWVRVRLEPRRDAPRWPWAPEYPSWIFLGQLAVE